MGFPPNRARPCAFVFLRSGDRILVSEMFDEDEGAFYRPPGGGIEFGERSGDAAVREMREELGLELRADDLSLLGVIENLFEYRGEPGHEICFVYEAGVDDAILDRLDGARILEGAPPNSQIARIFHLPDLLATSPLYPDDVVRLLTLDPS